ncbi:MAG TPA: hypothetical protein VIF82_11005 [Burkholderiaceae bacterium]|jgi:hypothetical protein
MHRIFDKTNKGREEIATRKYRLAPRLRTLLLLIDGRQSTGQVLQKIAGLDEQSINELLDGGFIQDIDDISDITTVMPIEIDETETPAAAQEESLPEEMTTDEAPSALFVLAEGETKFQAIHKFYTETIRTTLGLRGYNFQLKVDQAESIDDLHALHEPYIAAVLKARGDVIARDLHLRLEQLFNLEDDLTEAK